MAYGRIFRCQGTGLIVVVDEVEHRLVLAAVSHTVYPVVGDVVDEVEHASPTDTGVTTCIVGPQVAHETGVLATDG